MSTGWLEEKLLSPHPQLHCRPLASLLSVPSNFAKVTMTAFRKARKRNNADVIAAQCSRVLLDLRRDTGETQAQVAKRLRMTESMISRLESGTHVPSLKTLCRIADAFDRELEIAFHEHEHTHADGTRHSHPHHHLDPDHRHTHGGKK